MKSLLQAVCLGVCVGLASPVNAQIGDAPSKVPTIVVPQSKLDTFVCGVYWPWERTEPTGKNAGIDVWQFSDKTLRDLRNVYHCDLIWVVNIGAQDAVRLAGLAARYNIGVVPVADPMLDWRNMRTLVAAETC